MLFVGSIFNFIILVKYDNFKVKFSIKTVLSRATLGRVCLKLVVVMGVTWMADVISWAVGGPHYFWYLTDLINALQGVLIFIVVGCQPQVCIFL